MSHESKGKDRQSKYSDQSGSSRSSMPRWTGMGNVNDGYGGYEYMDPWGKMGLKYAPQYYHNEPRSRYADPSENSSSSGDTDSYVQNEKPIRKRLQGRKLALIVIVVGLVAIAAAITVILVLSLKPAESQPNKFRVVTMSLAVAETFKPEYKNQSSSEYKSFAGNFTSAMDEIFQANNTKGYKGIQIVELKNGSVIVIFIVVIEFKQSEGPPGEEVLKTVITGQKIYENDNNNVVVKNFKILKGSISIVKTEEFASNPISTTAGPSTISTTTTKATTTTSITSPPSQGQDNFSVATVNLAVDDTFKPEYNNTSSVEYQIFAADFTNAMDKIFNTTEGYKGSQIKELKTGSVIVIFIIVIEVNSNVKPLGEEELKAVITGQKRDANDNITVVIERFRILTTSVSIVAIDKVKANPIFPTDDSTTTKSSTPATTFPPSTSTTLKANVTASTSASNVQLNSSTTPSTLAVSTPPTPTSSTLQPSTTTTSTSTITTTATTTITSPNTTVQKAISTTILTSLTTPIVTISIATTQTSLGPGTISTSNASSATTLTSTTANTTSPNTQELKVNSTTVYSSTSKPMSTIYNTSLQTIEQNSTTTTLTSPATTTPATSISTSLISQEPNATNVIISTLSAISTSTKIITSLTKANEPNTTTTTLTSTTITKPTTTTTSPKIQELSTTSFIPSTISTTLSNSPTSTMATTTASTTTTAANVPRTSLSSTEPYLTSTTTSISTTSLKSTTISTTTPKYIKTISTTAPRTASITHSSIIAYNTTSPKTDEANMTSTTISRTTISLKPGTNSTTWSNNPTSVMSATTSSTLTTAANGITLSMSSTKPPEPITTSATTPTSVKSSETTSTTPAPTSSLKSTITSTISTKSPDTFTTTATTSASIATSIKSTLSTTNEPNTTTTTSTLITMTKPPNTTTSPKLPELSTTSFIPSTISTTLSKYPASTMASTTASNTTTAAYVTTPSLSSNNFSEPNPTSTTTLISITSLKSTTIGTTTPKYIETISTTATTATSTTQSSIITYSTTSPKPDEANMTRTTLSTTKLSIKPATNSTTWSNNPTSVWTATTSSKLTTAANVTTLSMSPTKPPEPNTTSATTTTSATSSTITSTTPTPTTSLKSNITSTVSTKSSEPTTTTATTTKSIATSIKTTLSTTSPKPTETNLTNTTASTSTTNLSPITTSNVLPNITELNTTITSTSTSTTTLMPKTTSTFLQSTSEPNATNSTTWTTAYTTKPSSTVPSTMATTNSSTFTTKPSSAIPSTMATTNSSTVSTVSTNSTMGPSSTSYKTIATTSTTPKGVAFNTKYYTAVVGVSLELMCTVTSWNGNLSVSRLSRTNQQEITVVNFVNNKTGTILNGFAVNITFTGYNVDVSIFILNTSCEDEGTYYCTTGAVTDNATVKRKRDKPILQLPDIMIRDNYHNVKYPFLCETGIDDSGEILIAEVNQNGTFYLYAGYAESRVNITTDCGNKQRFTFYINGRFTSVWDNAKIRCVLINNSTNGNTGIRLVSEESTIRLVPADICMSVTQGSNISYPQSNCELFLTCLDSGPVPGKCKQGQCFYDNIGMCRALVYCNDADASIGEPTSITCSLLFCNDSFSLTIKHLGDTLFSSNNITGNISQRSEERDIKVSLTNGKAELTVSFLKTNCNHSGEYIIILGRENVTDRGYLTFKVPPKRPNLLLPQYIVAYTQATITCSGEQGIPRQNMYIEVMFNGSNYTKYENTILTTDDKNCSSMGTLVMNFLVVEKWQHARVRCVIGDNSSSRLESDVYEINTTSSGIIISPSEITGFINDTVQTNCTVTGILSNDSVIISRFIPTIQGEEILSILTIGNSIQNNLTWIRFSTTVLSDNNMIIHITINFLQCRDGGTYRCKTGNRTAIASLAILSKPDKPSLMLPLDIVSDGYNQVGDPFVCKGNVGYPGGNLLAQIKSNGTFKEVQPFKVNLIRGNISNCQNVDILEFYLDKFTMDLHNSTLRCVATNNVTIAFGQTDPYDEKVLLLVPGTTCYGKANGLTLPYPYPFDDCKKYVFCTENRTYVKNGGCQDGECYYTDMKRCEQERTTTTIAPTTTTKLTCPFLYCRDTDVNLGDSASITCEILYCNDSFSLSIKHSEDTIFSNVNISGNISMKSDDKDIQILVSRGAVVVTLTINKTNCSHTGEYIIDLDRGTFIDRAALRLKVPPKKPILQLPQSFVADTDTTIYCTGEQGVPQQAMYMEVMFNSGNFSKYDKTTLTRNSQNCSNMGTLAMHILVEDIWDGARIRCVIGDNSTSRMESEVHAINITYPGVRFSSTKFTGLINGTVQMNCTVNGVFNGDNIIISRSNSASLAEETLSIITIGNSTKSNHTGLQIGITNLSANDMIVHVNMDSLQCHEGGTYHCKTGNRTAATKLEIWRKPDKPKLKLPVDVISDGYNQAGDPFVCEGNVGYPGGNLIVLFNKDGNFNDAKPFKANMTTGNVTECGRVDKFEFYLNKFTTDLHNTTVRCVATNTNTLSGESAPFEDKVLLLVPGDKCYGVPEGLNLPYPYSSYDCGKYLYCSWNRTFVKDGGCKYGECYYTDMKRCEQERTTTTTKPTTTTQVARPSVTCSGAEPVINSNATITCVLILCGDLFDLIIELDSKVKFRETMRGNRTYPFLSNALLSLVLVDNNTAKLNIGFQNIMCNQSGAYNVSIYGGNVSSVAAIRVTVNSEKPNITAPRNIYKDQKAIISCIGQLGIPTASMFWQLKLPGGNFESYSVNGSPDIYKSDCSVIGNWIIGIYPEQSWNGGGIRCGTKTQGNPSSEIYSDAIAITLEEPDIYFVPSSSSGYIGSSHSITCIARNMANITSVKIERQTISGLHEVAHLNIDGTSQTNFIGIRIRNTSMINSTAANVYMDFDNLTCVDKGDYFCTIGAFSSRGDLIVLRLPEAPQMVTFPTSGILQNTASGTINCTGEVGYPARKIVFESNKGGNNTFTPVPFNFTSSQMEGECSNTYSATFSYMFDMDWNSTVIRCKIDTGDVLGGSSLYVDRKVLIIPGNICNIYNDAFVPHPYSCGQYVWCADRIYLQQCASTLCHLTVPVNISTSPCGYCNGCIDSF